MKQTSYYIAHMDCGAEEAMVRSALAELAGIRRIDFDLNERTVQVIHDQVSLEEIGSRIGSLNLGDELLGTDDHPEEDIQPAHETERTQRRILWTVLFINFGFFLIEMVAGAIAGSMGLIADSLDMLADAIVYALSLWAVGTAVSRKRRVATLAGYFQLALAGIGFAEVVRRFIGVESLPDSLTMISVSVLALIANSICLYLLQKTRDQEAHMKASMIFTSNDVVINSGVILAGVLVIVTGSRIPDLVIGAVVFVIVFRGALRILSLGRRTG